jgi:hypothetical protein
MRPIDPPMSIRRHSREPARREAVAANIRDRKDAIPSIVTIGNATMVCGLNPVWI